MSLNEMAERAYQIADASGFWPDDVKQRMADHAPQQVATALCLVHTEVSEAMEDVRTGRYTTTYRDDGKPRGFATELADVIIRVLNMSHGMGIDIEKAVREKMDHNATRAHRHGGKIL